VGFSGFPWATRGRSPPFFLSLDRPKNAVGSPVPDLIFNEHISIRLPSPPSPSHQADNHHPFPFFSRELVFCPPKQPKGKLTTHSPHPSRFFELRRLSFPPRPAPVKVDLSLSFHSPRAVLSTAFPLSSLRPFFLFSSFSAFDPPRPRPGRVLAPFISGFFSPQGLTSLAV